MPSCVCNESRQSFKASKKRRRQRLTEQLSTAHTHTHAEKYRIEQLSHTHTQISNARRQSDECLINIE